MTDKKEQGCAGKGENGNPGVVQELLIRLLIVLVTWLLTKLSTALGKRKSLGE